MSSAFYLEYGRIAAIGIRTQWDTYISVFQIFWAYHYQLGAETRGLGRSFHTCLWVGATVSGAAPHGPTERSAQIPTTWTA